MNRLGGWLPHASWEWIELIVAIVLLYLLMIVALSELELRLV